MLAPSTVDDQTGKQSTHFGQLSRKQQAQALSLKGRVILEVNRALQDPRRAISDAIIGAVMVLASHEFTFGDRDRAFGAHMAAFEHLVDMRGGPHTLSPTLCMACNAACVLWWSDPGQSCGSPDASDEKRQRNRVVGVDAVRRLARIPLADAFRHQPKSQVTWDIVVNTADSNTGKLERLRMLTVALDEVTGAGYKLGTSWLAWGAKMDS